MEYSIKAVEDQSRLLKHTVYNGIVKLWATITSTGVMGSYIRVLEDYLGLLENLIE